jgi:hypothetical protein
VIALERVRSRVTPACPKPPHSLASPPRQARQGEQSSRTSAGLVCAHRGTTRRQSSPTPSPPPPPLPHSPLRRATQAKVRADFVGSVATAASSTSPELELTVASYHRAPFTPFLHSLSFPVSPRSSYRASLRMLWPDIAGAPS